MNRILFICTGNYYRSRFAEEYFNFLASGKQLHWKAFSKGLSLNMPNLNNPGPISVHTLAALKERNIPGIEINRNPQPILEEDFSTHQKLIAISEVEHKPMIEHRFIAHADKVEYFEVGDLPVEDPKKAIHKIASLVDKLLKQILESMPEVSSKKI